MKYYIKIKDITFLVKVNTEKGEGETEALRQVLTYLEEHHIACGWHDIELQVVDIDLTTE